jgi:hypothetical protein
VPVEPSELVGTQQEKVGRTGDHPRGEQPRRRRPGDVEAVISLLIIPLKTLESDVFASPGMVRAVDHDTRRRLREWLITSFLETSFGATP